MCMCICVVCVCARVCVCWCVRVSVFLQVTRCYILASASLMLLCSLDVPCSNLLAFSTCILHVGASPSKSSCLLPAAMAPARALAPAGAAAWAARLRCAADAVPTGAIAQAGAILLAPLLLLPPLLLLTLQFFPFFLDLFAFLADWACQRHPEG